MTLSTGTTKTSMMDIICPMTASAFLRNLHCPGLGQMTGLAIQILVFAINDKVRVSIVIETPDTPVVRRMAQGTFFTHPLFVHIILKMTADTTYG